MKIFTQTLLAFTICLILTSCKDMFGDDEDPRIDFNLVNKDNTVFSKIELHTKIDSLGVSKYAEISYLEASDYEDHKLPTKDLPAFGLPYRNLKGLENGTFEIRATKPDSSQLIKEFGVIMGDQTQQTFFIELSNNDIVVK